MNYIGLFTIIRKEIDRTRQVFLQAVLSPFLSTFLYFIVFGTAIGSQIGTVQGVSYGQFIVPGMIALAIVMNAILASSSGIYFLRFIGTITDILSAPLSYFEVILGYSIAAAIRSLFISALIYATALLFVPLPIAHPLWLIFFLIGFSLGFALLGLVLGIWAKDFEQLSFVPTLIITPLSFLGGVFYSLEMLPPFWQTVTLFNPLFFMVEGLRYGILGSSSVPPMYGALFVAILWGGSLLVLHWMFKTGYRIRS